MCALGTLPFPSRDVSQFPARWKKRGDGYRRGCDESLVERPLCLPLPPFPCDTVSPYTRARHGRRDGCRSNPGRISRPCSLLPVFSIPSTTPCCYSVEWMRSWQACSLVSLQGTVMRLNPCFSLGFRLLYDLLFQSGVQASLMGEGTQRRPRCNVGHTTTILKQECRLIRE